MLPAQELYEINTAFASIRNSSHTKENPLSFQNNRSTIYLSNIYARENSTDRSYMSCPHIYQQGNSYAYLLKGDHVFKVGFVDGEYDFKTAVSADEDDLQECLTLIRNARVSGVIPEPPPAPTPPPPPKVPHHQQHNKLDPDIEATEKLKANFKQYKQWAPILPKGRWTNPINNDKKNLKFGRDESSNKLTFRDDKYQIELDGDKVEVYKKNITGGKELVQDETTRREVIADFNNRADSSKNFSQDKLINTKNFFEFLREIMGNNSYLVINSSPEVKLIRVGDEFLIKHEYQSNPQKVEYFKYDFNTGKVFHKADEKVLERELSQTEIPGALSYLSIIFSKYDASNNPANLNPPQATQATQASTQATQPTVPSQSSAQGQPQQHTQQHMQPPPQSKPAASQPMPHVIPLLVTEAFQSFNDQNAKVVRFMSADNCEISFGNLNMRHKGDSYDGYFPNVQLFDNKNQIGYFMKNNTLYAVPYKNGAYADQEAGVANASQIARCLEIVNEAKLHQQASQPQQHNQQQQAPQHPQQAAQLQKTVPPSPQAPHAASQPPSNTQNITTTMRTQVANVQATVQVDPEVGLKAILNNIPVTSGSIRIGNVEVGKTYTNQRPFIANESYKIELETNGTLRVFDKKNIDNEGRPNEVKSTDSKYNNAIKDVYAMKELEITQAQPKSYVNKVMELVELLNRSQQQDRHGHKYMDYRDSQVDIRVLVSKTGLEIYDMTPVRGGNQGARPTMLDHANPQYLQYLNKAHTAAVNKGLIHQPPPQSSTLGPN
ncbi:MAG: hypothetical protein A3F18_02015 [Legionellales bacterium RIFCSPHIGHO2_12_FULL_37_14]|nr:MAG: hypothetical protein A3F18_02015 [Legionellales bacterium RIFCSPHIGHO2_12_FULL_37_14]